MKKTIHIFWFRRDLRLEDNVGLYHALTSKYPVLPLFIFDTTILEKLPESDARVQFIYTVIKTLDAKLKTTFGSGIKVEKGTPEAIFKTLISTYTIDTVFTNHDYEPYAKTRDKTIENLLNNNSIQFKTFKDQVIFEKDEVVKKDGTPYKVYTPYMKSWKALYKQQKPKYYPSENVLTQCVKLPTNTLMPFETLGFKKTTQHIQPFTVSKLLIQTYEATRNFPAQDSTSKLGPHLRFGTVSIRNMVNIASQSDNEIFWQELIWREFFTQILWHYPYTHNTCFKPKYERIEWRNNPTEFKHWCNGTTGYPFVDAGMRQLNKTGFMHNRVRMLVGSFLCKHLLIDWRWGEAYFAEKLHDYDMASNVGNWQWVAGCGVDAAPYFRIFNPTTQITKFDKHLNYIKKWVPEFQELTYASPIVDHKFARERCLATYKNALN